jgi:hypothetical protein
MYEFYRRVNISPSETKEEAANFTNLLVNVPVRIAGIPLSLVYLLEPYVFQVFISSIQCNKLKNKKINKKYSAKSLNSFLNAAMNIEFVSMILLGVNNFL